MGCPKEMFDLPDGTLAEDAGFAAEEWAKRAYELEDLLKQYKEELDGCIRLADELDSANPDLDFAFTGTPGERIRRQYHNRSAS